MVSCASIPVSWDFLFLLSLLSCLQQSILFYFILIDKCRRVSLFCPKALSTFWIFFTWNPTKIFLLEPPPMWLRAAKAFICCHILSWTLFPSSELRCSRVGEASAKKEQASVLQRSEKKKIKTKELKTLMFLHISKMWHLKANTFIVFT